MADETTSTETLAPETVTSDSTALGGGEVETTSTATETGEETALGGKPEGEAVTETTDATEEAAAPVVPDAYELAAPEGLTIDPASVEMATPVFKELGLSNEQANKLMPVAAQFAQKIADQYNQQILSQVQTERKAWLDTAKADPEIGGQHFPETIQTAAKALDALGLVKGSPFRNLLDESGLGNHPEMIRAFQKVGKAIGEDGFISGNRAPAVKKSDTEILYPSMKSGQE